MNGETNLEFLQSRRSVRHFSDEPVPRLVLERLLSAAMSAPSSSNRQPWRFAVVTSPEVRRQLAAAVRERAEAMRQVIERGHHAEDFARYSDFFHEPLERAAVIIVPQYRVHPDLLRNLVLSGGGDPGQFPSAGDMQAELCSTSASIMLLLVQAHAEGLGACWMAGPMVGRDPIYELLHITPPWQMVGAIALGYPRESPPSPGRKPAERVVDWFEEEADTT
jgi:nitroreductase